MRPYRQASPWSLELDLDAEIGARLRARRLSLGKSEWDLGYEMGLTGSQVLAFETGAVRLSAAELWLAAQALDVPVTYFFEGLGAARPSEGDELTAHRLFARLPRELQTALLELMRSVAGEPGRSGALH